MNDPALNGGIRRLILIRIVKSRRVDYNQVLELSLLHFFGYRWRWLASIEAQLHVKIDVNIFASSPFQVEHQIVCCCRFAIADFADQEKVPLLLSTLDKRNRPTQWVDGLKTFCKVVYEKWTLELQTSVGLLYQLRQKMILMLSIISHVLIWLTECKDGFIFHFLVLIGLLDFLLFDLIGVIAFILKRRVTIRSQLLLYHSQVLFS